MHAPSVNAPMIKSRFGRLDTLVRSALALQMMIEVEQARPIIILAWRRFLQQFRRRFDQVWKIYPRSGKNAGIVDGHLINEVIVGRQPQPLDDVQLARMKVAVLTEPSILDEIRRIDDQDVLLPVSDGITVIRGIGLRVLLAPIHGNDAVRITRNVFVK